MFVVVDFVEVGDVGCFVCLGLCFDGEGVFFILIVGVGVLNF